jgi:hypothetical protein
MKEIAEDNAARVMSAHIDETLRVLENDFGWDVEAYAPYPSSLRNGRIEFKQKLSRYQFVRGITTSVKACRFMNEPDYVTRDDKKIARGIEKARELAAETFEAYAYKLTGKVGTDVVAADAVSEGNDLLIARSMESFSYSFRPGRRKNDFLLSHKATAPTERGPSVLRGDERTL